jgi:hypothetical protein
MKRRAEDTARRYHELRKQVAGRTGLADDSVRLDYLTLLSLQVDRVKLRLINGDDSVASSELLALQNVIEQVSPEPSHNVVIKVCKTLTGVCPHCHGEVELGDINGQPLPDPPPPSPRLLPSPSAVSEGVDNA